MQAISCPRPIYTHHTYRLQFPQGDQEDRVSLEDLGCHRWLILPGRLVQWLLAFQMVQGSQEDLLGPVHQEIQKDLTVEKQHDRVKFCRSKFFHHLNASWRA